MTLLKGWELWKLSGPFDDKVAPHLEQVLTKAGPNCRLDLSGITSVNSFGVRAWILFLKNFERGRAIVLENCSPAVTEQMAMLSAFYRDAKIKSVQIPYLCNQCGLVDLVLVDAGNVREDGSAPASTVCSACKGHSEAQLEIPADQLRFTNT
jgi:ABC-type transporter Mla MlaB component